MKSSVNIVSIILFLLWGGEGLFAQHKHEFSLYGGGGLSTLNYKATFGEQKYGLGGHLGLGYHFFFSPKWGLGTGAELAFYNARFNMSGLDIHYMATDMDGTAFEFRSAVNSYKEKQRAMLLQIPLMLQFQTGSKHQFFIAAGGKAGIPLKEKYSSTASLSNAGFYAYESSLYDTQEFMGFGNFSGKKSNGSLDFKTAFFVSAETGVKWRLGEKWSLYTGLYLDYGLNNILKKQNVASQPSLVVYNSADPPAFAVNSIIKSQYNAKSFTDKITPMAVGIKLRVAFGIKSKRVEAPPVPIVAPTTNNAAAVDTQRATAEEAARKAAEEAARKAAEEARKAAEKVEADRLAQEQEAQRKAQQEAQQETNALNVAKRQIQQPIENYDLSQTDVVAYQKKILDEKIALLQQYPNLRFYIYGHTCEIGSKEVNERVGLERAAKAKAYMRSKGIAENRILGIASKRDTEPVVPNTSEENRKKNRRVQLVIQ